MRLQIAVAAVLAATACSSRGPRKLDPDVDRDPEAPASYLIERAALAERYTRLAEAETDLRAAMAVATTDTEIVTAQVAAGRIAVARGRGEDAVVTLEAAWERARQMDRMQPTDARLVAASPPEVAVVLGRAYLAAGRLADARRVVADARALPGDVQAVARLRDLELEVCRLADTLEACIAEYELAPPTDEWALQFVIAAIDTASEGGAARRVAAMSRLAALRPDDPAVAAMQIDALAAAGQVDDAIRLARQPAGAAPAANPDDCLASMVTPPPAGRALAIDNVVHLLVASERTTEAFAEIEKLATGSEADAEPVGAALHRARLYEHAGSFDRADAAARRATEAAHTPVDRRRAGLELARSLARRDDTAALEALATSWRDGDDACLRDEGIRRLDAIAYTRTVPPTLAGGNP